MSTIDISRASASVPVAELFARTIDALAQPDAFSISEVLADCSRAAPPESLEEYSRALAQQAALAKMLEQTSQNLRVLRREGNDFRYGRRNGRNR
jgi:hypothetical protein